MDEELGKFRIFLVHVNPYPAELKYLTSIKPNFS